ncbi:woronin body major protein [Trichophyton violaceum]|uniref:Woronin body major protein n=1 Tax=Trichophyton violaceum TaxID=34388 RepID=A0A178FNM9_TRIVO|nr:woronin body major protein [Trichophyton violaceum]
MEHGGRVEADGWGRQHATLELELELELERARAGEAGSESLHELAVWWQPTTKVHDVFSIGPFVFTTLSSVFIPLTLYPSFHRLPLSLGAAKPAARVENTVSFRIVTQFERHSRKDAPQAANLDFDARVPIPFSVFPSSYRSDAAAAVSESTQERVEGEVKFSGASRVGREDTRYEGPLPAPRTSTQQATASFDQRFDNEEFRPVTDYRQTTVVAHEEHPRHRQQEHIPEVQLSRERYYETRERRETELDTQLDITERQYRARTDPRYQAQYEPEPRQVRDVDVGYSNSRTFSSVERPSEKVREVDVAYSRAYETVDTSRPPVEVRDIDYQEQTKQSDTLNLISDHRVVQEQDPQAKMGYYDDEGQYHSFRRGVERAAERVLHPLHHRHHHHHHQTHEDGIISDERRVEQGAPRETVRVVQPRGGHPPDTITIPCHFIRIGDLLILQGRPCQVIRVSVSQQTGQHRYLGVDLFTRQLHEESSFISNPSPSVVVQSMLGPVYKTYRVLDMRDDNRIVAMTETGDVKQGLRVVDQGNLFNRIADAFAEGRGSVRALVINDGGRELVVDYKVIHGSRL